MTKLKLKNSLAKTNYVKTLIQKGICEIKELADYESHKMNPQLINDIMVFIENEISQGKFSKEDFDKSGILQEILKGVFDMTDDDISGVEQHVQFLLDNKLVKANSFLYRGLKFLLARLMGSSKVQ
jgi:hypothetical protein